MDSVVALDLDLDLDLDISDPGSASAYLNFALAGSEDEPPAFASVSVYI